MGEVKHQIWSFPSEIQWLNDHAGKVDEYMKSMVHFESQQWEKDYFYQDPFVGRKVVSDYITNTTDLNINVEKLLSYIRKPGVFVILILGMPGSGKTTTAYKICELLKEEYRILQVAPLITENVLPSWITWATHISKARDGDLCIVDEASIKNNARDSNTKENRGDLDWLAIGRQTGCKILYITQISAMADLNIMRWANIIISKSYKSSAVGMSQIERKNIAENPIFRYLDPEIYADCIKPTDQNWSIVTIGGSEFMMYLPQPDFMNEKLSKPYARFIDKVMTPEIAARLAAIKDDFKREEAEMKLIEPIAMKYAEIMKRDQTARTIKKELDPRGYRKSLDFWRIYTGEAKPKKDEYID